MYGTVYTYIFFTITNNNFLHSNTASFSHVLKMITVCTPVASDIQTGAEPLVILSEPNLTRS
jgi:hypothetical protein